MKVQLIDSPNDPVRLAFLHCFTKRPGMKNADGSSSPDKYEVTALLTPGGANEKRVKDAILEVAKEKYGDKPMKDENGETKPTYLVVMSEFGDDQKGLRKGNLKKSKSGEIYDGFEGMSYIVAKNETRPTVVDRDRSPLTAEDGRPYSGCYGTVHIDIWALNKPGMKKRIVSDLTGIQFTRDGDAFGAGSGPSAPDEFADLSAGEHETESSGASSAPATADDPFA
jgi:hypothetical protein